MNKVNVREGNCLDILPTMQAGSVNCCVTSPPYFGLRDYGNDEQIGLEETPEAFVESMVNVFSEVKRVLADDGTLWLNLGDSYASGGGKSQPQPDASGGLSNKKLGTRGKQGSSASYGGFQRPNTLGNGLKPKDLIGIPWRVAFALQQDGWYLRQDIIWSKPNPMPESVTDRCTKAHEYIFLLSKKAKYYYDADAVREDATTKYNGGGCKGRVGEEGWKRRTENEDMCRNKRSVWTVATQPYSVAHFATFPPDLIKPCILAGCPVGGTVLDPFGGSGTTGMVALELGRNAELIELNPDYVEIIKGRTNVTPGFGF
ncbi:site-specific DNA-methyltransferase [Crocinitomicaceae bacterium]|nr:site-specific DNA-methyltransferase [Crocinitomicaceae bacterium]